MEKDKVIFNYYKPFRNQLSKYDVVDSLQAMWAFSRNYARDLPFPIDMELPAGFMYESDLQTKRFRGIVEHEIDFLIREIIINGEYRASKSLKERKRLSKLVNYMRFTLIEEVDKRKGEIQEDFLLEFNRMAHQQYQWQQEYGSKVIMRYYKIFSTPDLSAIVQNVLGFSLFELYIMGVFYSGICFQRFLNPFPVNSETKLITNDMLTLFFKHYSSTLDDLKRKTIEYHEINHKLFYTYNPLIEKPIIIKGNNFFCPIPIMLIWQITSGTYYKILNQPGFENAFGNSFQNYTGEVLHQIIGNKVEIQILAETTYNKGMNRTSDWIVLTTNCVLFIECKTKRMKLSSKVELDVEKSLDSDLNKMASFVVQTYKTYIDYANNKYENIKYDSDKKFIPLLLTLEEWYLNFNPTLRQLLHDKIIASFEKEGLDLNLLKEFPYFIRSMNEFESQFQLACDIGIKNYFDKIETNELHVLVQKFDYKELFKDEFKKTFIDSINE